MDVAKILGVIGSVIVFIFACGYILYNVVDLLKKWGCAGDRTENIFLRILGVIIGLPFAVAAVALMVVFSGIQQGTITLPKPEPTYCLPQCFTPLPHSPVPFPIPTATPTPVFHLFPTSTP